MKCCACTGLTAEADEQRRRTVRSVRASGSRRATAETTRDDHMRSNTLMSCMVYAVPCAVADIIHLPQLSTLWQRSSMASHRCAVVKASSALDPPLPPANSRPPAHSLVSGKASSARLSSLRDGPTAAGSPPPITLVATQGIMILSAACTARASAEVIARDAVPI